MAAMGPVEHVGFLQQWLRGWTAPPTDERIVVRALGLRFGSPVGLAAGFDKNARRARALAALGFGHLELGTVTAQPQPPNPSPNLFRLSRDRALINRLGFPNEGAAAVADKLARIRGLIPVPVGISIGKSRSVPAEDLAAVVADYVAALRHVQTVADFVVVNVSSPNTSGLRDMQAKDRARALLGALAEQGGPQSRLLLKVAPDLDEQDLDALMEVVEEVGLAGVVATNTTIHRSGLSTQAHRVQKLGPGGLSGPPLRPLALRAIRRVRARLATGKLLIGVGGVETAEDALALVRAGAAATREGGHVCTRTADVIATRRAGRPPVVRLALRSSRDVEAKRSPAARRPFDEAPREGGHAGRFG
jgi:dihydroorotate dehydrogenase